MDYLTLVLFILGLALLVIGGELLVRGASHLAALLGVSPLVIGLTVVAFGTSAPEAAVSLQSTLSGEPELVIGNVIGSNIFNVLVILGATAVVAPIPVPPRLLRLDVPLMVGASLSVYLMALDGRFSRWEGGLLLAGIIAYTGVLIRQSRRRYDPLVAAQDIDLEDVVAHGLGVWIINALSIIAGLTLLIIGSRWLVDGAVGFAQALGVSELIIGLTIVAAGTSLPEVAASLVAALRGHREIAVGNAVGSNLFNLLLVLGLGSLVSPRAIAVPPVALSFDLPVMVAVAVLCLPIFYTHRLISRWEGLLLLAYYGTYTGYLVLRATEHSLLQPFTTAVLLVILPVTIVGLLVNAGLQLRGRPPASQHLNNQLEGE
jgi:cation:H+ antiporter